MCVYNVIEVLTMQKYSKEEITVILNDFESRMTVLDDSVNKLASLVGSSDGALFDAIYNTNELLVHHISERIGIDFDMLMDWWMTHGFGKTFPMKFLINSVSMSARNNSELANIILLNLQSE